MFLIHPKFGALMKKIFIGSLVCTFAAISCGKSDSKNGTLDSSSSEATLSYQYIDGKCDTQKHEFKAATEAEAKKKLCETLLNDEANHGCARRLRELAYERQCGPLPASEESTKPISPDLSTEPLDSEFDYGSFEE